MYRVLRFGLALTLYSAGLCIGQSTDTQPATVPVAPPAPADKAGVESPASPPSPAATSPVVVSVDAKANSAAAAAEPLAEALSLSRKGNLTGAIEKYQQVLQADPKSAEAYAGLVRVYLKQRNVDLASETAAKGMSLSDSPALHTALGEVYFRQGKIPEAEQEWVAVINSGHAEARAFLGLARVRNALSMYKKGKAMIDQAHELDPGDPDIQRYWVRTLQPSERIQALQSYQTVGESGSEAAHAASQRYLDYLKANTARPRKRCHLVSNVTSTKTPLERLLRDPTHLRGYGLTVNVNGHKTRLMLDTGASGILVDRGVAEKAGIGRLMETRIGGIGDQGSKSGYVGLASSIKIGELEFQDCPVEVLEQRSVVNEEGLIGADVFQDFLVDIDFPKEELRLSPLPKRPDDEAGPSAPVALRTNRDEEDSNSSEDDTDGAQPGTKEKPAAPAASRFHDSYVAPEMKSYTRVYRFGHDLLVPTKVGDSLGKLFLLDTGAWNNQITPAAAREVTKVRSSSTRISGIAGSVDKVYSSDKAVLQFGHLRQENQDLISFDFTSLSNSTGTEVSGTLGFAMLRLLDIKIDYRDGLIDLDYKPH
jgi:tetratricopeptide (TPR) repeat protein/predicted aspartyl protease